MPLEHTKRETTWFLLYKGQALHHRQVNISRLYVNGMDKWFEKRR